MNYFRQVITGASAFPMLSMFPVLGALLLSLTFTTVTQAQRAAPVTTDEVVRQSFTQTVPIIGKLTAKQAGAVAARISGTLAEMRVQIGDRVTRGQVLAKLDDAPLQLQLALNEARRLETNARLQTARAQLALAKQEVDRLRGLTNSAAVSQAVFDDARQRLNIATAQVDEASAALDSSRVQRDMAKLNLDYAEITAPFDGAITARLGEVGDYLQLGQSVARLVSDRRLELEADVPANRLGGLTAGARVQFVLDSADANAAQGKRHIAIVRAVVPEENQRTRTRRVRFSTNATDELIAEAGQLATEQSITLLIPVSARRDIVTVHKDAIVQRGAQKIVYVVADGVAAVRSIESGVVSGHRIEVLSGLEVGDMAVVRGNERLQPEQPVTATPLQ